MATPMYRQIAEDLREQIESSELKPGQQLQTEPELQNHYGASRNTVRDAIKWLTCLGLVETKPGQGTFVIQKIDPFVTVLTGPPRTGWGDDEGAVYASEVSGQNRKPTSSALRVEIQVEKQEAFEEFPSAAEVISRHGPRFIDGAPWSMQTSYYPMEFADRGAERLKSTRSIGKETIRYLDPVETFHIKRVGYRDWFTMRAPDATEADLVKLPPYGRIAMIEIFRTASDRTGASMRVVVTAFPADRNQFVVEIGDASVSDHRRVRTAPRTDRLL